MPDVAALLAELTRGTDDPDVVAEELRRRGVRGVRESRRLSPVAKLLKREGVIAPEVGACWVFTARNMHETPTAVSGFVMRFDAGAYPDLEIRGDDA